MSNSPSGGPIPGPVQTNSLGLQVVKNATAMTAQLSQGQHFSRRGEMCRCTVGPITPVTMPYKTPKTIKRRSEVLHQRERATERRHKPRRLKTADAEGNYTSPTLPINKMPNNYFRIRTQMRGHKTSNNKPTLEPDERTRGPVKINSLPFELK